MTDEELEKTNELFESDWFKERPAHVQAIIREYPPTQYYRFKETGQQCCIVAVNEHEGAEDPITFRVQKTGVGGHMAEMGLGILDQNQVFGVLPSDLEPWPAEKSV